MRGPRQRARGLHRTVVLIVLLALTVLLVPDSGVHPVTLRLDKIESAKHVDFDSDTVWFLVLGSDARPGEGVTDGRADAIQLVGINGRTQSAVGIGIPRDSWVELPGHGMDRINAGLPVGGPELMARAVEDLVGIAPDYVLVAGFDGFKAMMDAIAEVEVISPRRFHDEEYDLTVRRGVNRFDPTEALSYARTRDLPGSDFERSANQQRLMLGILRQMRAHEDDEGFMEQGSLAALKGLDTNLEPTELYRLAQAVTQIEPRTVTVCVVGGTPDDINGASIVRVDAEQAQRLGHDARNDARLDEGCR